MVSAEENIGHFPTPELGRTGVLGAIQQAWFGERFEDGGVLIAENAWGEAGNGVDHDCGAEFAAGEDEIAYGDLIVGEMFGNTLINAFVTAADQQDLGVSGKTARGGLIETGSLRGEEDDACGGGALRKNGLHGLKEGIGLEQHTFAAAEWTIIHCFVTVGGPISQVMDFELNQAAFDGSGYDAVAQGAGKEVGKDCKNVESHG
jgi:hypothetical protein